MHVQGDRWLASPTTFAEDMPSLWGGWFCDSEAGTLRAVLMHRPGPELDLITSATYHDNLFDAAVDAGRFRDQFDALADVYRSQGVTVHLVQGQRHDKPNAVYMRDLYNMTPEGAIVSRMATAQRRGEERAVASTLAALGVPILKTVNGRGTFEGSNLMWLNRRTVLLGTSGRTNAEGAAQVEAELSTLGVTTVLRVAVPYGQIHVDGYITAVDHDTLVIAPYLVSFDLQQKLRDMGFRLLEATNLDEVSRLGTNFVTIGPRKVVMAEGFPDSRRLLEQNGVEVVPVQIDEILRGGGGVHCMTGFLQRDPVA